MPARSNLIHCGIFLLLAWHSSVAAGQEFEDLYRQGIDWQQRGEPRKAAAAYEAALRVGNPQDTKYESTLANLGQVYDSLGEYARAEKLLKTVLASREARLGADHDLVGRTLRDLGVHYGSQDKYDECIEYVNRAIRIRLKYHPFESTEVLPLWEYRMNIVAQAGDVLLAGDLADDLISRLEARVGPNDWRLRTALYHLSRTNAYLGKYQTADDFIQRARRLPAPPFRDRATSYAEFATIANLYMEMGRHAEALQEYYNIEKVLNLRAERLPETRSLFNSVWASQGECLLELGQYERAGKLLMASLQGADPIDDQFAPTYCNLGRAQQRLGQLDQAETTFRNVMNTASFSGGHRVIAARQLAGILAHQGKTTEAEKLLQAEQGIQYTKEDRRLFANVYLAGGRLEEAKKEFLTAIKAFSEDQREVSREESACWLGLAQVYDAQKKYPEALEAADKSRRLLRQLTVSVLPVFPESEQQAFLANEEGPAMQRSLALVRKRLDDPQAVELSAAWVLNRKGLAQQALADRMLLAREADDPALAAVVNDWFAIRHRLSSLTVGGGGEIGNSTQLQQQIEALTQREQDLARTLGQAKVKQAAPTPWYALSQVRESLPSSAIYVDLVRFVPTDTGPDGAEYLAWLIPPANKGKARLVSLGNAVEIDNEVAAVRRWLQRAPELGTAEEKGLAEKAFNEALDRLSERLLKPLWSTLAEFEHWIISPDGTPWLVPWSALVMPDRQEGERRYVVEKHRVSFVTSGRDLIEKPTAVSSNPPLVFANPDFDLMTTTNTQTAIKPWFNRGAKSRAEEIPTNWRRLPGTAEEASLVVPVLEKFARHKPQVLLESQASEGAFKSAWRPRVVLLSTHGFFLPPAGTTTSTPTNPLLRCGLVLSGANRPKRRLADNDDDGIVTGLEVLAADLRGTELVVLSACETGLGELHAGEGVAGLRQAFQLAGARSVVSTLWQIPDQETAWLMNAFFEQLAAGADKATALQTAQRTLLISGRKNKENTAHPYYWAAFSVTGDWRVCEAGPATPRPERPAPAPQVEVIVENARIMDGNAIAAQVRLGERLVRGEERGGWIQVYFVPGSKRSGWIHQNEVRGVQ